MHERMHAGAEELLPEEPEEPEEPHEPQPEEPLLLPPPPLPPPPPPELEPRRRDSAMAVYCWPNTDPHSLHSIRHPDTVEHRTQSEREPAEEMVGQVSVAVRLLWAATRVGARRRRRGRRRGRTKKFKRGLPRAQEAAVARERPAPLLRYIFGLRCAVRCWQVLEELRARPGSVLMMVRRRGNVCWGHELDATLDRSPRGLRSRPSALTSVPAQAMCSPRQWCCGGVAEGGGRRGRT